VLAGGVWLIVGLYLLFSLAAAFLLLAVRVLRRLAVDNTLQVA
jgi:hypothetical protein